ncbi:MAG TPA: hypothetical protein VI384_02890 [Candidatus Dormibacteraeota bacterium]
MYPAAATASGAVDKYGPNSAEVTAFIETVGRLTPGQWRKVVAAREAVAKVTRDGSGQPAEVVRALLARGTNGDGALPEPFANVASDLAGVLAGRSDEEAVAAWQAASALVRRRQLAALTFAAHYAPFAAVVPLAETEEVPPIVRLFANAMKWLSAGQWESLARPWSLDREASTTLLQAAHRSKAREAEEFVALAAIAMAARHIAGDSGWAAVKTAVHGARVLASRGELTAEQTAIVWAPLEDAIPLRSLTEASMPDKPSKPRAKQAEPKKKPAPKAMTGYGANNTEVTAFLKAIPELTAIQWLRVLDRRQLVASVTREGADEPAVVVRSVLAALRSTGELELEARCAIYSAVERAAFALAAKNRLGGSEFAQHYGALAEIIPVGEADADTFAGRIGGLNPEEWTRLSAVAPAVDIAALAPFVNAGDAMAAHLAVRTDAEAVVAWHALAALLRRHQLSPIKFAVSYAPFASAIAVTKPKAIPAVVQRYLTAVGRLSAHQCAVLAEPWLPPDDVSSALARATAGGATRAAEEAAALAALVTVPMRVTGDAGWAASKTAAYGGRVIAARSKLTDEELLQLWKPIERAIPMASLGSPSNKSR